MFNKTTELRFIRLVNPVTDASAPADFELVGRCGKVIPVRLAWKDLPQVACWLGFGTVEELTAKLEHLEHWTGAILDMDPPIDWSMPGDKFEG